MSISERTHMSEPARRIEVFTGAGRRRTWSMAEKAAIIAESEVKGETVCGVARRHGLTPQQLFTWRREARAAAEASGLFVPAVTETPVAPVPVAAPPRQVRRRSKASGIEFEIGGVVVRVGAEARPAAIAAVIRALRAGT